MDQLKNLLTKLPVIPMLLMYCGWLAYDHYTWITSPSSELAVKKNGLITGNQAIETLKKKLIAGEQFYKNLEIIRARILQLNSELDSSKAILSADIDLANFVSMVSLEAKKLGLVIKGIRPEKEEKKDYYVEFPYTLSIRGAYVQILVFLDRIAKFQRVIGISSFSMKPLAINNLSKYVALDGVAKLVAYKYVGSAAVEVPEKTGKAARPVVKEAKEVKGK